MGIHLLVLVYLISREGASSDVCTGDVQVVHGGCIHLGYHTGHFYRSSNVMN